MIKEYSQGEGQPPNNRRILRDEELGCELTNKVHNHYSTSTFKRFLGGVE